MSFGETEIVVSGYAIKSDNSWRVPESFWKLFGIFRNKNRKCFGAAGTALAVFRR